jgi:hypothetical protein
MRGDSAPKKRSYATFSSAVARAMVRQKKTGRPVRFELTVRSPRLRVDSRLGLDVNVFGTHSLRRTKATLIYRRTGNLRAVSF